MQHFMRRAVVSVTSAVVAAAGLAVLPASAAEPGDSPMASSVPNSAFVYVGWAGSDAVAQQYEGTHAQAVLQASNFPEVADEYLPKMLAAIGREVPDAAPAIRSVTDIGSTLFKHPTALAFGGVDWQNEMTGEPMPRIMLVCDAGDDAAKLRAQLNDLFRELEQPFLAIFVKENAGRVYFALGFNEMDLAQLMNGDGPSLAASNRFTEAFAPLAGAVENGVMKSFYLDMPRLVDFIKEVTVQNNPNGGDAQVRQMEEFLDALGLDGIGRIGYVNGFSGQMYASAAFAEVAAERRGLTRLLPPAGAGGDEATLAAIPADATIAGATRFELDQLIPVIRNLANRFNPEQAGELDRGLAFLDQIAGANLENDLIGQFGSTWAAYVSPSLGNKLTSGVLVNSPKDAATLERSLASVSLNLVGFANQQLREETENTIALPARRFEAGEASGYVLNLPLIAPSFALDDSQLMLGFYPQSVVAAQRESDRFVDGEAWQMMTELADGNAINAFTYANLPETASDSYPSLLSLTQLLFGAGDLFSERLGVAPPVVVLPDYATLREHLTPSAAVQWTDDQGIHYRATEPFPLSGILASDVQSSFGAIFQILGVLGSAAGDASREFGQAAPYEEDFMADADFRFGEDEKVEPTVVDLDLDIDE